MIEAQIICSNPCDLPDLGIYGLKRGEERWVTVNAATSSSDLRREQRKGNVRVYRKVRHTTNPPKRPAPPFVAGSRPMAPRKPPPEPVREVPPAVPVDAEEIAAKIRSELLGELIPGIREAISQEVGKAVAQSQAQAPAAAPQAGVDPEQLEAMLKRVVATAAGSGGSAAGSRSSSASENSGPEEPLFIPSKIVDKDTKGKIKVKSAKSEGGDDLDEAKRALAALKRGGGGRKKGSQDK